MTEHTTGALLPPEVEIAHLKRRIAGLIDTANALARERDLADAELDAAVAERDQMIEVNDSMEDNLIAALKRAFAAEAAIKAVQALHQSDSDEGSWFHTHCPTCGADWPCATFALLPPVVDDTPVVPYSAYDEWTDPAANTTTGSEES